MGLDNPAVVPRLFLFLAGEFGELIKLAEEVIALCDCFLDVGFESGQVFGEKTDATLDRLSS